MGRAEADAPGALGAALARLELSEALTAVAARYRPDDLDLACPDWYPLTEPFRGLASIPVRPHPSA